MNETAKEVVETRYIISQHIGWLKMYALDMTPKNWRDMRDRSIQQLDELSSLIATLPRSQSGTSLTHHQEANSTLVCALKEIASLWGPGGGSDLRKGSLMDAVTIAEAALSNSSEIPNSSADHRFPIQKFGTVPWYVAERAYEKYAAQYGTRQSLERLAERGGFGISEMDDLFPAWREEAAGITSLYSELAALKEANSKLVDETIERAAMVMRSAADDTIRAFVLLVPEAEHTMTLEQFAKACDEVVERVRALKSQGDG